jgi:hypothetical protein
MTLIVGEALNRRSDLQKRIAQLQERVSACVLAQEGEEPPERPEALLAELCDELQGLIAKINHTNAAARLASGETVTEALARRDVIALRQNALRAAIKAATGGGFGGLTRYSRSEIRTVRQVQVGQLQTQLDALARQRRELDNRLQEHNWQATLME